MARALAEGVIVVAAMENETTEDPSDSLALWKGICGIGATTRYSTVTEYTNRGNGVMTTALGTVMTRDTSTGRVEEAEGTSFATPIIAGYGLADPVAFLRSDPSQYANENPCVPQGYDSVPSWDDVADYMDGVVNPILIRNDDVYVYRGVNENAALSREHGYPTHIGTARATTISNEPLLARVPERKEQTR